MSAGTQDPEAGRRARRRRIAADAMPVLLALAVAAIARHAVVEPAAIAHACAPAPWAGWCAARTLLVYGFATQGIGWLSLGAGALATLRRHRPLARLATIAGAVGLVLYSFEPSALGALLGLMVLVRVPPSPRAPADRGSPTQAAT